MHTYYYSREGLNENEILEQGSQHYYELAADGKVVIDYTTGLIWQQSGSPNPIIDRDANAYIYDLNCQNFAGYSDWRFPTLEEAMSLVESQDRRGRLCVNSAFDPQQWIIRTTDRYNFFQVWGVCFLDGFCYRSDMAIATHYIRAVR